MKKTIAILTLIGSLFAISGCDKDLEKENDKATNFNTLWSTIDQKYCFFEFKKDSIKDWNEVYKLYYPKACASKTNEEFFYVLADMLNELKDGHVNLTSTFDASRYDLQGDYEDNFIKNTIYSANYLGTNYRRAGGLYYKMLEPDSIGYIYYPSFSNGFSEANINNVLRHFEKAKGIIVDIRGNGGGLITNANRLASHFTPKKTLTGYFKRKTGPAHNAFSDKQPIYINPANGIIYAGPTVVLTNRDVYSAANLFTQEVQPQKHVLIMGDKTGGGSGVPANDELPCGWTVRYSSAIYLDSKGVCTEWGIEPDLKVSLDKQEAYLHNTDSIIEQARALIMKAYKQQASLQKP